MRDRTLKNLNAPSKRALILVCKKCDGDPARELYRRLKDATKERFGSKDVRVLLTSCMNLCPKKAVAVSIVPLTTTANRMSSPIFCRVLPNEQKAFADEACEMIEKTSTDSP